MVRPTIGKQSQNFGKINNSTNAVHWYYRDTRLAPVTVFIQIARPQCYSHEIQFRLLETAWRPGAMQQVHDGVDVDACQCTTTVQPIALHFLY